MDVHLDVAEVVGAQVVPRKVTRTCGGIWFTRMRLALSGGRRSTKFTLTVRCASWLPWTRE
jgi:hypothetical protein